MRFVWLACWKDLCAGRRDPLALIAWLGMPLMVALMMNLIFGKGEAAPQGRLLVADEDGTIVSGLLTGAFTRGPLAAMFVVESVPLEAGRKRIDRGDGSALLIIPKGMQSNYLDNKPVRLQLFTNPSQRILPKIVEETMAIVSDAGFYLQSIAGEQLRSFQFTGPPDTATVVKISVAANQLATRVGKYLNPPLIEVEMETVGEKKQIRGFGAAFFPGMLFMAILFIANGCSVEMWKEKAVGTLRRLLSTPAALSAFLAGRALYVALLLAMVAMVGFPAMLWLNVTIGHPVMAALWVVASGVTIFLMFLFIAMQANNQRSASVLGNLLTMPLMFIGGGFFPFEMMPEWMANIGRLTPNGWMLVRFQTILAGSAESAWLAWNFAALAAAAALFFGLSRSRLRKWVLS